MRQKDDVIWIIKKYDRNMRKMDDAHMLTWDGIWAYLKHEYKKSK